jgi:putative flavoprotein involved in K+ transport
MLYFSADLKQNLDQADAVADSIKNTIDKHIEAIRADVPRRNGFAPNEWALGS